MKMNTHHLSGMFRRGLASTLAVAMLLPTVAYGAGGTPTTPGPIQVKSDSEFPNIEIQTNFVRSEYGVPEGTMELALRVGPSVIKGELYDDDDNSTTPDVEAQETVPVQFRNLSVNLKYDPDLYTPVSWTWTGGAAANTDLPLDADKFYSVDLPAKKNDLLPTTGGVAKCGVVTADPADPSAAKGEGLVYFKAEAYNTNLKLTEMTTLAVIRFKINESLTDRLSIAPTDEGDYTVSVTKTDGTPMVVTNVDELHQALGRDLTTDPNAVAAVGFASDAEIEALQPPVLMALHYTGANDQQFYYVPGCNVKDNPEGGATSTVEKVWVEALEEYLPGPKTKNNRVLALDEDGKGSFLSNHFDERDGHRHISWPVVSQVSFAYQSVNLDNYTTVVYVDWDNSLLGTQILPKGADVREMVNKYVSEHFIYHNDDNSENLVPTTKDEVSSLKREDSYRGKYPTTPQPLGSNGLTTDPENTVRLDGKKYPLTNKLDYVFFKRPMEFDENEGKWVQKADESDNAIWDEKYPFAYGWAKCTVDNYADTWTTLGMGELSDYNGSSNGGYKKLDSGVLASFSYDSDTLGFKMMDFKTGFEKTDNTVFLKAVYEPGVELQAVGNPYRMISEPYYNKLNKVSSANGGAWSVDVTFERSSEKNLNDPSDTRVRGVARIREPVVRQDTTVDMLWETFTKDGEVKVDHDLPNANLSDTYSNKNKSLFTKIEVPNTEEVPFSLTLTARQNRADYYLKDAYGYNFVAGGDRTVGEANRSGSAFTMDNYNYFVDGENESGPVYAAIPYASRDGSYGFVLTGTLNQLMELSTRVYEGEMTAAELITYLDLDVFNDINIKASDGSDPDPFTNLSDLQQAVQDAGKDVVVNHKGDPDYWDSVHECAQLTYHQFQLYIMGRGLLTRDAADDEIIGHCHLHTDCVASVSNKPTTWDELIDAAQNHPEYITELTGTEAEALAHLRKDSNGTGFGADVEAFKNAVVAAVNAGNTSWDEVQAHILNDDPTNAPANYWWYDGATNATLNSWGDLLTAADAAMTNPAKTVKLPDGTPVANRPAKLNQLEAAFDANGEAEVSNSNLSGTDPNWVKATENLVKGVGADDTTTDKFDDFDSFKTALLDALKVAYAAGEASPDWYQIQYMILNPTATFPPKKDAIGAPSDYEGYWWHNGGINIKITDLNSMLRAARLGADCWKSFTFADMDAIMDGGTPAKKLLYFAESFDGTPVTAANFATFKTAIETIATNNSLENLTWEQVQYLLIHTDVTTIGNTLAQTESGDYYWWKGGETTPPTLTHNTNYIQISDPNFIDVSTLIKGIFRLQKNGIPATNSGLDAATIKGYRLRNSGADTADFTDSLASDTEIIKALSTLFNTLRAAGNGTEYAPPTGLTWFQLQYAILNNGAYIDTGIPTDTEYWWRLKDGLKDDLGAILALMLQVGNGTLADKDFYNNTTNLTATLLTDAGLTQSNGKAITNKLHVQNVGKPLAALAKEILANHASDPAYYDGAKFVLTVADLQAAINAGSKATGAEAFAAVEAARAAKKTINELAMGPVAPVEPVTATVTAEDGTTTTTESLTEVDSETGYIITTTVTTVVSYQEKGMLVVETTTVNTLDPTTGVARVEVLDTVVAFVPNEEIPGESEGENPDDDLTSSVGGDAADTFPEIGEGSEGEGSDVEGDSSDEIPSDEGEESTEGLPSSGSGDAATTFPPGEGLPDIDDTGDVQETPPGSTTQNPGSDTLPEVVDPDEVGGNDEKDPDDSGTGEPGETEPPVEGEENPDDLTSSAGGETAGTFPAGGEGSDGEGSDAAGGEAPDDDLTSSVSGETADTFPVNGEGTKGVDPPDIVTTLASSQKRLYRMSARQLKAPPWLRSPNIPNVTTQIDSKTAKLFDLILTFGRTPK